MQSSERNIKSISEGVCPHCGKSIMVSNQFMAPAVDWILKKEDLNAVKEKMKAEIEKVEFKSAKAKEKLVSWMEKEDTIIGPDEYEVVLSQIIEDNKKTNDNPKKHTT